MTAIKNKILEGEILSGAEEKAKANETKVRSSFWKTMAKAADKVPFVEELVASYYCALDPNTPILITKSYIRFGINEPIQGQ